MAQRLESLFQIDLPQLSNKITQNRKCSFFSDCFTLKECQLRSAVVAFLKSEVKSLSSSSGRIRFRYNFDSIRNNTLFKKCPYYEEIIDSAYGTDT